MKRIKYILLLIVFLLSVLAIQGQSNQKPVLTKKQNQKEINYTDSIQAQLKMNSLVLKKLDSLQKLAEIKNIK